MLNLTVSPDLSIEIYDSIEEMPINADLEARQYATIDASLASNESQIVEKRERIELLASLGKKAESSREQQNLRLAENLIEQGYNAHELQWACFIHSINGLVVNGLSEDALTKRIETLKAGGLSENQIAESLDAIKENMQTEMMRCFPKRMAKGKMLNNLSYFKAYGLALIDYYETPNNTTKERLDKATINLLSTQEVFSFANDESNVLDQIKHAQDRAYKILTETGVANPKSLTVYEYNGWLNYLEEKYEAQKPKPAPQRGKR